MVYNHFEKEAKLKTEKIFINSVSVDSLFFYHDLPQVSHNLLTLSVIFCGLLLGPGAVSSSSYITFSSCSRRSDG
ncbi:hypothetical protein BpHYR1_048628 [Brachionus plicatilis]|uniref:Uncharacterized protein n=1 Tax=Brachionus plicatilis TaxID=10195 RepID=A0A3M7PVM3_BRAPC|nr:hypothetical protein BpHYR1_048628 [Brachionus plicatilis]